MQIAFAPAAVYIIGGEATSFTSLVAASFKVTAPSIRGLQSWWRRAVVAWRTFIFFVADMLKPLRFLAAGGRLLDCQVHEDAIRSCAVPMRFARIDPYRITWTDFPDGAMCLLYPADSRQNV
jgi:hypothetical protein